MGYAKEGKRDPYLCLANIAMKLGEMEGNEGEKPEDKQDAAQNKRDAIYLPLIDLLDPAIKEKMTKAHEKSEEEDENGGVDVASSLPPSKLSRKNAVRDSTKKSRPRSISEGHESLSGMWTPTTTTREGTADGVQRRKPVVTLSKFY